MKNVLSTVLFSVVLLIFQSCTTTYYQVCSVSTKSELAKESNSLIYENEDCKVIYNFWRRGGNPGFKIFNKTDRNIYIDLSNSFFINNNTAFDYYKNREFNFQNSHSISENSSVSISKSAALYGVISALSGYYDASVGKTVTYGSAVSIKRGESHGITFHEKPIVCIPPNSEKYFSEHLICSDIFKFRETKQDYPKASSTPYSYQMSNSPIIFKNIISYFTDNTNDIKSIENEFFVSEIVNYTKKKSVMIDHASYKVYFRIYSPEKFYNTYTYSRF
jgi:hypothetical protein